MPGPNAGSARLQWLRPAPPVEGGSRIDAQPRLAKTLGELEVQFDPQLLAIGMTTAPRRSPTLETTLDSLRYGQFSQTVHLFAEPSTFSPNWNRPGVVVHQNQRQLGCYPNWLQMARWLVEHTDCPFLLLLEDDGLFCRGAAPALYYGLTQLERTALNEEKPIAQSNIGSEVHSATGNRCSLPGKCGTHRVVRNDRLPSIGCLSLYTPHHNYQLNVIAKENQAERTGRTPLLNLSDGNGRPAVTGNSKLDCNDEQFRKRDRSLVGPGGGWVSLDTTDRWGTVAQCFPRSVLQRFLQQADDSKLEGTDRYLDYFLGSNRLQWYSHVPSLVDHIGVSSTLGHVSGQENAGVDFRADFVGYRHVKESGSSPYEGSEAVLVPARIAAGSSVSRSSSVSSSAKTPLVSIVLPAYNGEKYLHESIESCLTQSFTDWELILVDDGSTDGTDRKIRSFHDPRILSIRHSVNRRLPAALNTGFRLSRGEFLTWTSCDNRYAPQALETMVEFLKRNPATDLVYSDLRIIDESGAVVRNQATGPTEKLPDWNVIGACFLYRREMAASIGEYTEECFLAEDYDYWLRASQRFRLTHLPVTLYDYRMHSDSLTARYAETIPAVTRGVKARHESQTFVSG